MNLQNSGLGVFSRLPYELREQIWLHFLPVDEESESSTKTSVRPDLRVLLASKNLYNEISVVLYSKTCLHFDISSSSRFDPSSWCTVHFTRRDRERRDQISDNKQAARWRLESRPSCRDHHFDNFPFHKIRRVEVSLSAPNCEYPEEFIWLWRNVVRTSELFREASPSTSLIIQLRRGETHDWLDMEGEIRNLSAVSEPAGKLNYELLILPFYNVRHLTSIKIEPHSEELGRKMNWSLIDWASDVVSKRNGDCETHVDAFGEQKLWVHVFDDYLWVHEQIFHRSWEYFRSVSLKLMCREWICQEFCCFTKDKLKRNGRWITNWTEIDGLPITSTSITST